MNHIFLLSSAEARRLWECLMDPPPVHVLWSDLTTLLCDLFDVERTNLFLVIPEKEQLRSRAASQFQWDIELPWNTGIAGHVFQNKTPLLINNIPASEYGHHFNKDPQGFQTQSMLTVPVHRDGDEQQAIVAVIQLVNKHGSEFSSEDLEAMKYWSRQIGVSIERTHGTEVWRHPESEPPYLEDPHFDPIFPALATKQAELALPGLVNLIISELGNCHLQLRQLSWARTFWESRELVHMVRNGYRHARRCHQLSGEATSNEKNLGRLHRYFVRLMRWVANLTRDDLLHHTLAVYEEWLGFYASAFSYWLCQKRPQERNLLYSLVEDKRTNCIFYESRLLDYLIQHPNRRQEFRLIHLSFRFFYSYLARRMVATTSHVSKQKNLPAQFDKYFLSFTKHRITALAERAQARIPEASSWPVRVLQSVWTSISLVIHGLATLVTAPFALVWPQRSRPVPFEEIDDLLDAKQAASA